MNTSLKVESREHGQHAIVNADMSKFGTGTWGERYVCLSGYCGPYNPALFAAAPELLEALVDAEAKLRILSELAKELRLEGSPIITDAAEKARAAIAKATA